MTEEKKQRWLDAMNNLMKRRADGGFSNQKPSPAGDYEAHIKKVHIGKNVLDIGCGSCAITKYLPSDVGYLGLDPFPVENAEGNICKGNIEDQDINFEFPETRPDTIIAFAVLDGCIDLPTALSKMNALSKQNIVILTGIDIEPDRYHTHKVQVKDLLDGLPDFDMKFAHWPETKVLLADFHRIK